MRSSALSLVLGLVLIAQPSAPTERQTDDPTAIVVFAPSSLSGPLTELAGTFMLSTSDATGVSYKFDDPAMLTALIQQGADADVFATPDTQALDSLRQKALLDSADTAVVRDRLAIVVTPSNPQGIQAFRDLASAGMRFIIPAPSSATTASILTAFDKASADPTYGADFHSRADRNVLARDGNDRLVVDRLLNGEVSAGLVYASSVDPQSRRQLQVIDIPDPVNAPVDYAIAVLRNGTNPRGGRAFVNYVQSAPAQNVFGRWGFTANGGP